MQKFKFEKLTIGQKTMDFGEVINQSALNFPPREKFDIAFQISRSADSSALNISEGSIGQSNPQQRKFIRYAIRSLAKVVTCLFKARKRNDIKERELVEFYDGAFYPMNMMSAFRKNIR